MTMTYVLKTKENSLCLIFYKTSEFYSTIGWPWYWGSTVLYPTFAFHQKVRFRSSLAEVNVFIFCDHDVTSLASFHLVCVVGFRYQTLDGKYMFHWWSTDPLYHTVRCQWWEILERTVTCKKKKKASRSGHCVTRRVHIFISSWWRLHFAFWASLHRSTEHRTPTQHTGYTV